MSRKTVRAGKPAVVVWWIDHAEPEKRVWDAPTDPRKLVACLVCSVGFVQSENDDILEISRDLSEHGAVGACLHIIKKCIVSRKVIRVPRVPR